MVLTARKGSGLENCIPLHFIHFYKTSDPERHPFSAFDPFSLPSGNNVLHHVAVHIGQAIIAALEFVGVFLVIDADQV